MTTGFGTGIGGTIGGPQTPTQIELEASAWTQVNKAALGIVPDSIEVPFTKLGGQLWKYQSDASRPTLMSLGTVRTSLAKEEAVDESWKPFFDELVGKLPPDVKEEFTKDLDRDFEDRSQNFTQLENALTATAKSLAWLARAQKPLDPHSPAMDRLHQNQALPGRALRGTLSHSGAILEGAAAFLNRMGSNYSQHDVLRHFATQSAEMQENLNSLLEVLKDPGAPPPTGEELMALSEQAEGLLNDFQRIDRGKDLQILSPMMEAMAAVASALSLTPASPTLFLGLKLATLGLYSSDSQSGLLGNELAALIKALQSGQGAALLQKVGPAKLQMLLMSLLGTISGANTLAALLAEFGIGRFPARNEGDQIAGRRFGLQLMLSLLASSGVMKQIYAIITEVCGGDAKAQEILSTNMELVSLLLMSLTATKGGPESSIRLLESLKPHLEKKLEISKAFIEPLLEMGQAKGVDIAITEASLALERGEMKGLLGAMRAALELINSSPELLKEDLDAFKEFAILLKSSCSAVSSEENAMMTALLRAA